MVYECIVRSSRNASGLEFLLAKEAYSRQQLLLLHRFQSYVERNQFPSNLACLKVHADLRLVYSATEAGHSGGGGQGGKRLPPPVLPLLPPVPFCELSPASRRFSTNLAMLLLLSRPI